MNNFLSWIVVVCEESITNASTFEKGGFQTQVAESTDNSQSLTDLMARNKSNYTNLSNYMEPLLLKGNCKNESHKNPTFRNILTNLIFKSRPTISVFRLIFLGMILYVGAVTSAFAQSSTCIPGMVENANGDPWSEECYLNASCEEQGSPCNANDVQLAGAFLADSSGNAVPICNSGASNPVYLFANLANTTGTDRYAVRTRAEVFVDGVFFEEVNNCAFDLLSPGQQGLQLLGPFTYTCGQEITLENIWIGYETSAAVCSDINDPSFIGDCNSYAPSKCFKAETLVFLVPNFDFACGDITPTTSEICFSDSTSGGTPPYTYLWDFGDGNTSTLQNPCHVYSAITGTFTVTLTVTDSNGTISGRTLIVDLDEEGLCCVAPVITCPADSTFACLGEVPVANINDVTFTEGCGMVTIALDTIIVSDSTCVNQKTINRVYSATDNDGNVATCAQVLVVNDNIAPMGTCPTGTDYGNVCASNAPAAPSAATVAAVYTDNCGTVTATLTGSVLAGDDCGWTNTHTYTVSDGCTANDITCVIIDSGSDDTAPTADQAAGSADYTGECDDDLTATLAFEPTFTDNCTASGLITVTLVSDVTTVDPACPNAYVRVRTWTGDDGCGNVSANYVQTITITDDTAPTADQAAGSADYTGECDDDLTATLAFEPTFTDNCTAAGSITVTLVSDVTTVDPACANAYVRVRTWTGDDGCGNVSANYVQTITITDDTAPTADQAAGSADYTGECDDDLTATLAFEPTFTDNCTASGLITVTLVSDVTTPDGTCANAYVRVRTWTGDDGCGNVSANYVQTITITDDTAPTADQAAGSADYTGECDDDLTATLAFEPTFTDNCTAAGSITVTLVSDVTTVDGTCANAYVRVRTWTGDDGCGNVSANYVQTITITDDTAPTADQAAGSADFTGECDDDLTATLAFEPTFMDNCTASGLITVTLVSDVTTVDPACANAYVRVRTWTGDDGCVNVSANFVQTITITDDTAPTVDQAAGSADYTGECDDDLTATLAFEPTFTDNCTASGLITVTLVSDVTTVDGTCPNAYVRVRTWTGDDGCGNVSANYVQTITITDDTAPTADQAAGSADYTGECDDDLTATLAFEPTFTDNCTASGLITVTLVSDVTTVDGTCANAYVRVRTWTGDDGCGNVSANYVQTITITDDTAPTADQAAGSADFTGECDDDLTATLAFEPTFTDNCTASGLITVTLVSDVTTVDPACANAYVRVRTWTGDDGCGNVSANYVQTITITDDTAPTADQAAGSADFTGECDDDLTATLAFEPTFMDNCTASGLITVTLVSDVTTVDPACANAYVRVRTWTGDDGCGNVSANFVQTITITDDTAPTVDQAAGSADFTGECDDDLTATLAFEPTFMDNCTASGLITVTLVSDVTTVDPACANGYVRVRTWTGDDGCGNVSANYVQTITITDDTAPTADQAAGSADYTGECDDDLTATLAFEPTFTDNCTASGSITVTLVSDVTTVDGTCANGYVRVRTWTGDDGCGNVSENYVQTITITDTAPTADQAAGSADFTGECDDDLTATLAFEPTFTDNCTASGLITVTLVSDVTTVDGTCPNAYVRVRTWTGDDGCGNVSANLCTNNNDNR